jgi:hypothetical protein
MTTAMLFFLMEQLHAEQPSNCCYPVSAESLSAMHCWGNQSGIEKADKSISFQRTTNILIMDNASWH